MSLFAEPAPRVFALPPGVNFAEVFARGLTRRLAPLPPEARARAQVMVSTRRALRATVEALAEAAGGTAVLPRVELLTALGADPLACPELPPAIDPLRRELYLVRLVEAYLGRTGEAPPAAAPALAEALARLLDEMQEEGVPLAALEGLVEGELAPEAAAHWQRTLDFLAILREHWPEILAREGALDPHERQRRVVERLAAAWTAAPPAHPVIAAGSTGALASTAELLATIARLPAGAVVLPGFDRDIGSEVWERIGPEHPMAPFRRLLEKLGLTPAEVPPWDEAAAETPRLRLLRAALRPAPVTDAWRALAPALAREAEAATAGITLVEAPTPRHEAAAIALAVRRALEAPERRIAIVTADATLARRVTVELERFRIVPDDSLGRPLLESPPAVLLRHLAALARDGAEPVRLAALLAHPLMQPGMARAEHLALARRYELAVLRAGARPGLAPGRLPPWEGATEAESAWLEAIEEAIRPLAEALATGAPLGAVLAAHVAAAEALTRPAPEAAPALWEHQAGATLREALARLAREADAHGAAPAADYPALLAAVLGREQLRPEPEQPHPRVMIWGTHEARVQSADLMILGGLNEGVWPAPPGAEPWLSRPMRAALGLPSPDAGIGLAAHDFLNAAARAEVMLTRARKVEGTPTVASRWLVRLLTLLEGVAPEALAEMRRRGAALLALVEALHRPRAPVPRAARPRPRPPAPARPRRLSVTRIETLIRDAYAIYAEKILRLAPLDPLGREPDALERGTVIHRVMEAFGRRTMEGLPEGGEAEALLLRIAREVLARDVPWPEMRRLWFGRIARAAPGLIAWERAHRQRARPLALERHGRLALEIAGAPFEITARADRIDRLDDGTSAVIDYKGGRAPSEKQIEAGFYHQLQLQAAMLAEGGFDDVPPLAPALGVYLGLVGTPTEIPLDAAAVAEHLAHVRRVLETFALAETPYVSRGRPLSDRYAGPYDHLARRAEWEGEEER